ncbi:MAG TPA: AAA family ATPase [Candidatus Limnocylindrales bacterium]|nr:AAA family ATPase [Candidatus Limnocylindrales bacterium]
MATRVSSPILIGREAELSALISAWEAAVAGRPSTVLVGGEAGIGKSRLVGELGRLVREDGGAVLEGASVSLGDDEGLPLAPIADALRAMARQLPSDAIELVVGTAGAALSRLVPELGGVADGSDAATRPDWVRARMLEAVLGVLHRLGDRQPVLLVIEDLHWADRSTRDVLAFIARTGRTERLLVVATYRTDEIHRRHPLRPWLAEMERTPRVDRLMLERLGARELADLVDAIRALPPDEALQRTIADRSEGIPFYVEELLAAGATGANGAQDRLPADLREVLLSRVAALPDDVATLLGVAAVAGRSVEHDLLRDVAGVDDERLEAGMREAVAAGMVVATAAGPSALYAFRHALLQEAVYDDLLPTERRRHHATYAAALAERSVPEGSAGAGHLAALAHHASASHDLPAAVTAWIAAGRASVETYAFAAAARSLERALDLWEAVPADDRPVGIDQVQVLHELAFARMLGGETSGAVDAARRAVELNQPAADPVRAAILLERLGRTSWVAGEIENALQYHADAVALLDGQPPSAAAARVRSGYGGMLMLRGNYRRALEVSREAIEAARAVGAEQAELYALNTVGVCLATLGDCAGGIEVMRDAFERTKQLNDLHDLGRCYGNYATVLQICGRAEESADVSAEGSAWSRRNGVWRTYGAFHDGNRASTLIDLGRWREARALLAQTAEEGPEGVAILNHAINAGPLAVRMGDLDLARTLIADAAERAATFRDAQFTSPIFVGTVEFALLEGRLGDAWAAASDGMSRLAETDDAVLLVPLHAVAARTAADRALAAHAAHRDAEREAAIADARRIGDEASALVATLDPAGATAAVPLGYLAFASAEAERASGSPSAVDAWARAAGHWAGLGRPWCTAYARYREGEAMLGSGASRSDAAARLGEARATAESLGAIPLRDAIDGLAKRARLTLPSELALDAATDAETTQASAPSAADPFGLTSREREVLALVAAGQTNRRIAETLFISESTAGVHVSNILGKLGVPSRTEAATVAVRLGLAE